MKQKVNYADGLIYTICNTVNDSVYVGSTVNLYSRAAVHKHQTLLNEAPLYEAMRDLGIDKFQFEVLKYFPCDSRKALEAEEYRCLAEQIAAGKPVYNKRLTANEKKSDATKKAISAAKLGVATKHGCMRIQKQAYMFHWMVDGRLKSKSFSWKKHGKLQAKHMCYAFRKTVYPKWQIPEQEAGDQLLLLEI